MSYFYTPTVQCNSQNKNKKKACIKSEKLTQCFTYNPISEEELEEYNDEWDRKYGVRIEKSKIKGAGYGLFTTRKLQAGKVVVPYTGDIIDENQFNKIVEQGTEYTTYMLELKPGYIIDAMYTACPGRYANDPRGTRKNANVYFSCNKTKTMAYLKTIDEIPPNTEILVDYGKGYWDGRFD